MPGPLTHEDLVFLARFLANHTSGNECTKMEKIADRLMEYCERTGANYNEDVNVVYISNAIDDSQILLIVDDKPIEFDDDLVVKRHDAQAYESMDFPDFQ